MAKKVTEQKLVIVTSNGAISELGGITGPILNPCYVPVMTINTMLTKHRVVYEVNPKDYTQKVRLSLKNLRINNFEDSTQVTPVRKAPTILTAAAVTPAGANRKARLLAEDSANNAKESNTVSVKKEKNRSAAKDTTKATQKEDTKTTTPPSPTMDFTQK